MSTKTSIKRIALVAVSALGLGVLSSLTPASAATFLQANLTNTTSLTGISLGAGSGQTMAVARVDETYNFGVRVSTGSVMAAATGTQVNLRFSQVPAGDAVNSSAATGSAISPTLSAVTLAANVLYASSEANNTPIAQASGSTPAFVTVGSAAASLGTQTNVTVATASFVPKVVGTYKVFAWADTASTGNAVSTYDNGERTSTLTVVVGGAPATLSITAASSTAAANGGVFTAGSAGSGGDEGALFIIKLTDAAGNPTRPTTGESINLSTSLGTLSDVTLTSGDFNASGVAAVNLTHTAAGTATVTATSGGAMPTLTSKSASVEFVLADGAATVDVSLFTDTTGLSSSAAFTGDGIGSATARTFAVGKTSATLKVYGATASNVAVQIYDFSGDVTGYAGAAYSVPVTISTGSVGTVAIPLSALAEDDLIYVTVNASTDDTVKLTAAAVALDSTNSSLSPSTSNIVTAGGVTLTAYAKDAYGQIVPGASISWSVAGRNATTTPTIAIMDSNGAATYTLTDTSTSTTLLTSTVSAVMTYGSSSVTKTASITFGAANAVSTITATTTPTLTDATATSTITTGATGAAAAPVTVAFTVKDASGVILVGVPVTFTSSLTESGFANSATDKVDRKLAYTDSTGVATTYVYGWKSPSTTTVTATAGGKSATTTINFINSATDARTIAVSETNGVAKATVKDRYGNPVKGATVTFSRTSGTGWLGAGVSAQDVTTNASGEAEILVNGSATVKAELAVATYAQVDDAEGKVGTTATSGIGATLAPAGVASATIDVTGNTGTSDAIDAANDAVEAANAATDAANAAAEAADAATAAAQDAQAAVADLAAQVATLISGIKAQITRLTNLVIKIQKKVNA